MIPPDLVLRDATERDLPGILEIYNATIPSRMVTADLEPVSLESRQSWLRSHNETRRPIWVLADGSNSVVAWLSFDAFHSRPAYAGTAMIAVYVAAGWRQRGLGRALLQAAINHAPTMGLHSLVGYIFAHNEPSLRLFTEQGFERWGHLPRVAVLDGVERDLIILGRRVGA